jgi:hypothetical protein
MAGAVQVILPVEPHQKRIADFLPIPQIGQGTGIGIITGHDLTSFECFDSGRRKGEVGGGK